MPPRSLPEATPETRRFWEGCRLGELRLQRCTTCDGGAYFPPRPFCPNCGSRDIEVFESTGDAILWSYVINMRPRPDMGDEPYAIAVVKLSEGPTMMTNIVGCPQTPEMLKLDMPLKVTFSAQGEDVWLPFFQPVKVQSDDAQ
ncbi:MAG: OB-fold domain-containing protein [Phenylobacterium sp.]|nr:OB-fold domain-containing protein [Phenylobacterium sp.]